MKLSIIVPCYNVENYVEKSIKSLVNQTLKDIEIIAIDDGSTDNTSKILDNLKKKNKNLVVIHKKNEGVSIARNEGLKIAKGEYIGFLDSDDWVNEDCYYKMYNKIKEGYDIVACSTALIYKDHKEIIKPNISEGYTNRKMMIDAYAVIWNKIYKKELIKDLYFKEKMSYCEDVLFLYEVYSKNPKCSVVDEQLHNYLQREGSLTYVYDDKLYDAVKSMDEVVKYYKENKLLETYKKEIEYSYVRYLYGSFLKRLARTKNYEKYKEGIKNTKAKVKKNFPHYRRNKYFYKSLKGIYFVLFNKLFAYIIFKKESR